MTGNWIKPLDAKLKIAELPHLPDLHLGCRLLVEQSKGLILAIPAKRYPLQDWLDATSYITGVRCNAQSVEKTRAKIVAAL